MSESQLLPTNQDAHRNLRVLLTYARPQLPALFAGLLLALLSSVAALATPMITKWILDSLGTGASLAVPITVMTVLLVGGAAIGLVQWVVLGTAAEHIVLTARVGLVRRFFAATVPALQTRSVGELVTRVTSDTVLLREAASSALVGIINAVALGVGTLVMMAVLDLTLLGTTLVAIVIVFVLFSLLMPRIAVAEARTQESLGTLGGLLEGSLRAIRTVKASRAEARIAQRIDHEAEEAQRHAIGAVRTTALAWTISWTGVQGAIIVILGLGAWRIDQGHMEVSTLIAFLLYAFTLMGPVTELSQNATALQSGIAAAIRIRETEAIATENTPDTGVAPHAQPHRPIVELEDVTIRYEGAAANALDGVSLTIPRTGHLAIVGPSGAGKTTLLSLLLRFVEPDSGQVRLAGSPYTVMSHQAVRGRIAYVEQETPVIPGTVRDNLLFTHPDATDAEIAHALERMRLDGVVAALPQGLDTALTATSLSGGQRQRIAMARAILRPTDLLLLDEATAQVDAITEAAIVECIRAIAEDHAVVTVAHRLSTVRHADTIVVLEAGRIRAVGTHDELLEADELYRELVTAAQLDGVTV